LHLPNSSLTAVKIGDAGYEVKWQMFLLDGFMEGGFDLLAREVVFGGIAAG